jgi:integrase/recombinase XerD
MITIEDFLGLGLAPRTAYLYARMVDRAVPLLAERGTDLAACSAVDLAAICDRFPKSHSQRQMLRSALVAAWEILERPDPPVRALRVPPRPRGRCRALSEDGARQLERAAWALQDERCGLAVLIGLYSGLRRAEIARVRWDDVVDDEHGRPQWFRVRGKGDVEADVPIHPILAGVLERNRRATGYLFRGRQLGQPVSPATIWEWVRQVAAYAGMAPVRTHVLRHTALAEANDRTGDLRAVQELARHTSPDVTAIYTRVKSERLIQVVSAIDYGRAHAC